MNFQQFGCKACVAVAIVAGTFSTVTPAQAFSIGDTLQFSSNLVIDYDLDGNSPDTLNFGNNNFDPTGVTSDSLGSIRVVLGTGAFAPYTRQEGTIKDLSLLPATSTPVTDFLKIGDLSFQLNSFIYSMQPSFPFDSFAKGVTGVFSNSLGEVLAQGLLTSQITGNSLIGESSYSGTLTVTAIPTPALLPGLIGLGVAAMRKRKQQQVEET